MKETLKAIGGFAFGLALLAGLIVLAVFFIKGGVWLSEKLLPILLVIGWCAFLGCLFLFVPLAVFRSTRGFAGVCLYIASYIFGASAWMTGLLLSYTIWGVFAVIVGLLFLGVGVVPVALLATLVKGLWSPFFSLLLMVAATWGSRFMAMYVLEEV